MGRERLTARRHDIVLLRKDGELRTPMELSGQEIRLVMERLAEYEDAIEQGKLEPVRHGYWICNIKGCSSHIRECSVCGHHQGHGLLDRCPGCGAIMRSKQGGVSNGEPSV